jgi:uncharacterized protein YqeY
MEENAPLLTKKEKTAEEEGVVKEVNERIKTLKLIKSEFVNKNPKAQYVLTEDQETGILLEMAEQRNKTIEKYKEVKREDLAAIEQGELNVIKEFTPAQPTEDEIKAFVSEAIEKYLSEQSEGYSLSKRDMGKIMPVVKAKFPNVKGNIVSEVLNSKM